MYRLTAEGKKYLEDGLPEKRLLNALKNSGEITIAEAKEKLGKTFPIAIQWCKNYNIIDMKDGKIILRAGKFPEGIEAQENGLDMIKKGEEPYKQVAAVLLKRNLIEDERETITDRAEKLMSAEGEISYLLPDIIASDLWKQKPMRKYNVTAAGPKIQPGKHHPYGRFLANVKQRLVQLGFKEMNGPLVETEFWNFDALFQPQNHPARDWTDTYQLKNPSKGSLPEKNLVKQVAKSHESGWKYKWSPEKAAQLMPRAHTTAVSARMLASGRAEIPGKYFCIGRVFRPDVLDATHLIEFNMVEGIVLDACINFQHILGLLKMFATEFAGAEKVKFLPDYYPFTEPSVQMSAYNHKLGWVEFAGAGIFREELTKPLGIDVPVIAWGIGIDRIAMFNLGINDIRQLFSYDLKWLREAKVM